MKKGYLAKESIRYEKGLGKHLILYWITALIMGPVLFFSARRLLEFGIQWAVIIIQVALAGGAFVLLLWTLVFIVRILKRPEPYSNLLVYAECVGKETAGRCIDEEAAQGKILVEEYLRTFDGKSTKQTKEKIVLLPSYLLLPAQDDQTIKSIVAIPTDKIYCICVHLTYRDGYPMGNLRVFYDRIIQDIEHIEFLHTFYIIDKIEQHIPNLFYDYSPFFLSFELERLFHTDFYKFKELYNNRKEIICDSQELATGTDTSQNFHV